jgi:2,3-diketo-5-methylthiopentyl-1-phosphate enolase
MYFVGGSPQADLVAKASAIAIEQSTGSWYRVPGETDEVREKYAAKVIGIYSVPNYELIATMPKDQPRWAIIKIAFPWVNFYDNIPLMLSSVLHFLCSMRSIEEPVMRRTWLDSILRPIGGITAVRLKVEQNQLVGRGL